MAGYMLIYLHPTSPGAGLAKCCGDPPVIWIWSKAVRVACPFWEDEGILQQVLLGHCGSIYHGQGGVVHGAY